MFTNTLFRRIFFNIFLLLFIMILNFIFFYKIYTSDSVIISFAVHPFNICEKFPDMWLNLKIIYIPITLFSSLICINHIYSFFFNKKILRKKISYSKNSLSLFISKDSNR